MVRRRRTKRKRSRQRTKRRHFLPKSVRLQRARDGSILISPRLGGQRGQGILNDIWSGLKSIIGL